MKPWHIAILLPLVTSVGCNDYEMFRLAGYEQASFSNDADILFVVDNSLSMTDEATTLAMNIEVFIDQLTNPEETGITTNGLKDAAGNYIEYVQNRGKFVDYNLAITSTDAAVDYGRLFGDIPIIEKGMPDEATAFSANVLCTATCFDASDVASDPAYQCGDPVGEFVSFEYLNCLCGEGVWENNCGGGNEEHLESLFMAMCRAEEEPPADCYEMNSFSESDELSNEGLFRERGTFIPIIVTDEGDDSRRLPTGEYTPDVYEDLFNAFGRRMSFAIIGPRTDVCNSGGATSWGVSRLQYFVDSTDGRWFDIASETSSSGTSTTDTDTDCQVSDFASALEELGDLLNSLATGFPLDSIPNVSTIRVFVDGEEIGEATSSINENLEVEYSEGWIYDPSNNAVEFYGASVPDYNQDVEIYYLPLDGMPKELPF